jgi:hypothetical protein
VRESGGDGGGAGGAGRVHAAAISWPRWTASCSSGPQG